MGHFWVAAMASGRGEKQTLTPRSYTGRKIPIELTLKTREAEFHEFIQQQELNPGMLKISKFCSGGTRRN